MEKLRVADAPVRAGPASVERSLGHDLETDHVNLDYFELAPGETFAFGYHCHPEQEGLSFVLEGTATFETESGDVSVAADEVIRFAPGEWQLGRNDGEDRVVALPLEAPADSPETELRRTCPDCGQRSTARIERAGGALVTVCETCETELDSYT